MKEALLIFCVIGVFTFTYFLMNGIDKFLEENRKSIQKKKEVKEPAFVMLKTDLSDYEIDEEIHRFKSGHHKTQIILYDSDEEELTENIIENNTQNK